MKVKRLLLTALSAVILASSCGPSPEVEAARLINGLVTKAFDPSAPPSPTPTLPPKVSCKTNIFNIGSSTSSTSGDIGLSISPTLVAGSTTTYTLKIKAKIDAEGSLLTKSAVAGNYSFICNITANYELDPTTKVFKGTGDIQSCEGYECVVNYSKVSCDSLKTALKANLCE